MRTLHRIAALVIVAALASCSDADSPRLPLAPTPVAPMPQTVAQPPGVVQLRGRVWDTAFRPLPDVKVQVIEGPDAGASTVSDATGGFSLGLTIINETIAVRAEKDGYATTTRTPFRCQTCPVFSLGFQLAPRTPPIELAGEHTLTFVTDPACTAMPDELRTRSYTVTLRPSSYP